MAIEDLKKLNELYNKSSENFGFDFVFEGDNEAYNAIVFIESLRKENFKLSDLGISARILNHWKINGILPVIRSDGWNRFSFLEYIWLKIVISLRDFGFPLQKILKVKEWVFRPISKGKISSYDKDFYQRKYDEYKIIYGFNNLAFALTNMLLFKKPYLLVVMQTGESIFVSTEEFQGLSEPHINIPLLPIIKNFIYKTENIRKIRDLRILRKKEIEILQIIRSDKISEIKIHLKDGDITSYTSTKEIKAFKEARLMDYLLRNSYQKLTIKTENGNIVHCQSEIKKNLK